VLVLAGAIRASFREPACRRNTLRGYGRPRSFDDIGPPSVSHVATRRLGSASIRRSQLPASVDASAGRASRVPRDGPKRPIKGLRHPHLDRHRKGRCPRGVSPRCNQTFRGIEVTRFRGFSFVSSFEVFSV
jgi:hypothetical protein